MKAEAKYFFKKNIVAIIIAVVVMLVPLVTNTFTSNSYEVENLQADSYVIDATLNEAGDLTIHETIEMLSEEDMHVVFRDIPYNKNSVGVSTNVTSFDTSSVSVKVYNRYNQIIYDSASASNPGSNWSGVQVGYSWKGDYDELGMRVACPAEYGSQCASIFTYVRAGTYPVTTYEYTYTIKGAVTKFNDVAELNWVFASAKDTGMQMKNVTVNLTYPDAGSLDNVRFYGHSSTNGKVNSTTTNQVTFSTSRIKPYEELEARLILPASLFPKANVINTISKDYLAEVIATEASIEADDKLVTTIHWAIVIVNLALVALAILVFLRIYKKYDKELKSDFYGDYYRELPADYTPAEMGYLYNFKEISKNDVSATLLDLVVKKYIKVDYTGQSTIAKKADYTLVLDTSKNTAGLMAHEKYLLHWFFEVVSSDGKTLSLKQLEKFPRNEENANRYLECNNKWIMAVKKAGEEHDFFDKSSERAFKEKGYIPALFLILGFVCWFLKISIMSRFNAMAFLTATFIAIAIILFSYLRTIKRRSVKGNEEYVRWKSFKHFLEDFGTFEEMGLPSIILWEKYLVYATEFGIADLVEKQMRMKFKQLNIAPEVYADSYVFRYPMFYHYYNARILSSFTTASNTIVNAKAGKISGGGGRGGLGGFGGGSSFGGGGGGFRGR